MSENTVRNITRTVEFTIEGSEPVVMSYGEQRFTPRRLVVTVAGAPGATPDLIDCTGYGPRLLKSGKDGQEERDRDFRAGYYDGEKWAYAIESHAPQWVTDCVNQAIREFQ